MPTDTIYTVTGSELTSIADAIRTKGDTSASLAFPSGFVEAIGDISGGGGSTSKTCTVTIYDDYIECSNFSGGTPSGTYVAVFDVPVLESVGVFVATNGMLNSIDHTGNCAFYINDSAMDGFYGIVVSSQVIAFAANDSGDILTSESGAYAEMLITGTYTATVIEF